MNKKYILSLIGAVAMVVVIILLIIFNGKAKPRTAYTDPVVSSEEAASEEEGSEGLRWMETEDGVVPNGKAAIAAAAALQRESDDVYASCEEWEHIDENGYLNDKVVSCEVDTGTLSVGVEGASVAGEVGGLVLAPSFTAAATDHAYGIRLATDWGNIMVSKDGNLSYLTSSAPFTYVQNSDANPVMSGESFVYLGRTWDIQMPMEYTDPENAGICWVLEAMSADPQEVVSIDLQLFDLQTVQMVGIYTITVRRTEDGQYELSGIEQKQPGLDDETLAAVQQKAQEVLESGEIVNFQSMEVLSMVCDVVDYPYWGETSGMDKEPVSNQLFDIMGTIVTVTVNTNNISVGPITMYISVREIPSDDPDEETEQSLTCIAYDYPYCENWDRFVTFNSLHSDSYTVRMFSPEGWEY